MSTATALNLNRVAEGLDSTNPSTMHNTCQRLESFSQGDADNVLGQFGVLLYGVLKPRLERNGDAVKNVYLMRALAIGLSATKPRHYGFVAPAVLQTLKHQDAYMRAGTLQAVPRILPPLNKEEADQVLKQVYDLAADKEMVELSTLFTAPRIVSVQDVAFETLTEVAEEGLPYLPFEGLTDIAEREFPLFESVVAQMPETVGADGQDAMERFRTTLDSIASKYGRRIVKKYSVEPL